MISLYDPLLPGVQSGVVVAAGTCATLLLDASMPPGESPNIYLGAILDQDGHLFETAEANNVSEEHDPCWP